ncbi:MAG: hypothetical protein KY469_10700 [Actinobacteria bacterium]|nr:hypothetical protein [Actinomycetota bacterium]
MTHAEDPDVALRLTGPEQRWLTAQSDRQHEEAPRRSRSLTVRLNRAVDRYSLEAGWVAAALHNATAALPPQPQRATPRRGSGHADPTLSRVAATIDTAERAARTYAHLAGPCPLAGTDPGDCRCPASLTDVAATVGLDLDPASIVDDLFGTPATTAAFTGAVSRAAAWHSKAASRLGGTWRDARSSGLGDEQLRPTVDTLDHLASQMRHLASTLAQWTNRGVRRCANGCGAAAPPNRATCGRCRTARWREQQNTG